MTDEHVYFRQFEPLLRYEFPRNSAHALHSSTHYCGGWTGWWLVVPAWRVKLSYYGT